MKSLGRIRVVTVVFALSLFAAPLRGTVYPFEIFTGNGGYCDDPRVYLYADVTGDTASIDFTFYNDSTVASSIAGIYFDGDAFLDTLSITNGSETLFSESAPGPKNLPGGREIGFCADKEFSIGAVAPPPVEGINPGEWVKVTFGTSDGGTLGSVIDELNTGGLRVGLHAIAFPDGSSESAVLVPEPATLLLLGLGMVMVRKQK